MKVIVKKTGEIKVVSLGYALNFLLPQGLAEIATKARLTVLKQKRQAAAEQKTAKTGDDRQQAERLDGKVVEFKKEAGKSGKVHGSLTKKDIALRLKILKTNIVLTEPIKKLGEYPVTLKFGQSAAKIKVKVLGL